MSEHIDMADPGTVLSRRALITVIIGMAEHREALTVLGGHAVIEVTRHLDTLPVPDTTHDGDLGIAPQLLAASPLLAERMTDSGSSPFVQIGPAYGRPSTRGRCPRTSV